MTTKAKDGIWTPWAALLCSDCHGRVEMGTPGEWSHRIVDTTGRGLRAGEEDEVQSVCDKCGAPIWVDAYNVGPCATARDIVNAEEDLGASLDQTGGMCCACRIEGPANSYFYVTDGEDPDRRDLYCLGAYGPCEEQYEGVALDCWGGESYVLCTGDEIVRNVRAALAELPSRIDWVAAFNENALYPHYVSAESREEYAWHRASDAVEYFTMAAEHDKVEFLDADRACEVRDFLANLDYQPTPQTERDVRLMERAVAFMEWADAVCCEE